MNEEPTDEDEDDSESDEDFSWVEGKSLNEPRLMLERKSLPKNLPEGHQHMNACQVFQLLLPPSVMAVIVEETNKYAHNKDSIQENSDPISHQSSYKWQDVTIAELYCFLGLCVAMSIGPKGNYKTFWKIESRGAYVSPQFGRIMVRRRFEAIKSNLHFTNNAVLPPPGSPGYKKLGKLGTILDSVVAKFHYYMQLPSRVNVDEGMVRSRHRSHLRQYLKNKPDKYGFKFWCLN